MTAWEVSPSIGDEIAAYDESDKLIGSTVFNGDNIALTVWGDDLTTTNKDGLATGEKITLKLWNSDMNTESTLVVNKWDQGGDSYTVDGISIVSSIIKDRSSFTKEIIQIIDVLGRENSNNIGFQLKIYDNGSVEKKYLIN